MKPLTLGAGQLGSTGSNPVKVLNFFQASLRKLHKLHSLRWSFLHFHFISAVHIWFISYIINIMLATCVHWQEVNYGKLNSLQKEQPLQDKWERTSLLGGRKSDYFKSFPTGFENFFISRASLKVAEHSFGSFWVYVICQIMAREGLQLTSWNLASGKYIDERFWLTGKIWHFRSFHGNMNDWIQP